MNGAKKMKTFILFLDHKAQYNSQDRFICCYSLADLIKHIDNYKKDSTIYCMVIYETDRDSDYAVSVGIVRNDGTIEPDTNCTHIKKIFDTWTF